MKKINLMLLIILVILCSCNKATQMEKKIYGHHTVLKYTVNGTDSLSLFKDSLPTDFEFNYNEDDGILNWNIIGYSASGRFVQININWELENEKTIIVLAVGTLNIGTGPLGREKKPIWEIVELSKKHFDIKTYFNNKEYIIYMD